MDDHLWSRIERDLSELRELRTQITNQDRHAAILESKLNALAEDLTQVRQQLTSLVSNSNFVAMDRYQPVERIVYGAVALILLLVVTGFVSLVVIPGGSTP